MTPQTAAALRALIETWREPKMHASSRTSATHSRGFEKGQKKCAEMLAAVLTQEGVELWCMHIQGPDDVHAAPSKAHAEKAAELFNARFQQVTDVLCKAVVEPWPHSAESHAEDVGNFCANWFAPAEPQAAEGAGKVKCAQCGDTGRVTDTNNITWPCAWCSVNKEPTAAAAVPACGEPFDKRCADALADEVAVLVRRGVLDMRSPAADALLDYRNPPSSPRADRLAELEGRAPAPRGGVTEEMVLRFLSWKLPDSVSPGGLWPAGEFRKKYGHPLTGTNLLNDPEARAMLAHVLATAPSAATATEPYVIECDECGCRGRFCKCTPAELDAADRKAKHAQFTDPDFNRWLDDGISDCGHTVRDTITNIHDAWAAWNARPHYTAEHSSATGERTQEVWPKALQELEQWLRTEGNRQYSDGVRMDRRARRQAALQSGLLIAADRLGSILDSTPPAAQAQDAGPK